MGKITLTGNNQGTLPGGTDVDLETFVLGDGGKGAYSAVVDPANPTHALAPAADGSLAVTSTTLATQTTLAALLAKVLTAPSTEAKQDAMITLLTAIASSESAIAGKDFATQASLAAVLAKLSADPATQTTLAAVLAKLSSDPATQTTLAAILAKLNASVTVTGTFFQVTQPVSLAASPLPTGASTEATLALIKAKTDNIDVALSTRTKPADQQHVIVDTMPTTAVTGPLTDTLLRATAVPVSVASLPLPSGAAQDGSDISSPTAMPAGGVGIRGWLSAIFTKLNGSLAVTGTFWQATQPVSGTVTANAGTGTMAVSAAALPLPSGAATDANLNTQTGALTETAPATDTASSGLNGRLQRLAQRLTSLLAVFPATIDTNSGTKSASTLRVVLATDQPALTNKLLVTPDANSAVNVGQVAGTTADVNSGNKSAGTLRVVLATDQPALANPQPIKTADGDQVTIGTTTGAAVITDATGTVQQYLRGLVKLIAAGISVTASIATKTDKWSAWVSRSTGLTTELNSLANGAYSALGTAFDNTTNLDQYAVCEIVLASLNPTAGAYIQLFLAQSADGANYEDAPSSTNPGYHMSVAVLPVTTGSAAKRIITPPFRIPPGKYKLALLNATNVALASSANTAALYTANDTLV